MFRQHGVFSLFFLSIPFWAHVLSPTPIHLEQGSQICSPWDACSQYVDKKKFNFALWPLKFLFLLGSICFLLSAMFK